MKFRGEFIMANNYVCPNCGAYVMRWQDNCEKCNCKIEWNNVPNGNYTMENGDRYEKVDISGTDAIKMFFKTISSMFAGRARRKEYWCMVLFQIFLIIPNVIITSLVKVSFVFIILKFLYTYIFALYTIVIILPATALSVRRLHDVGKNGRWLLIGLIPIIGSVILIILMCKDGDKFENKYGASTKYVNNN